MLTVVVACSSRLARSSLGAVVVAAALCTASAARAEDRDRDGVDDVAQRARICGTDGERPVCDDLVRSLIEDDVALFMRVAAVDAAHSVRVVRRRRTVTYRDSASLERAITARGGLRAFFSGHALSVGTDVRLGGSGSVLEHDVVVGGVTTRVRFEADGQSAFHLVSIAFR